MNNNKLYKSKICEYWRKTGTCAYGENCKFAHGYDELNIAKCKYGNKCYNNDCQFKHFKEHLNKETTYIELYNINNLEIKEDRKDKIKILNYYIEELNKHIDICKNNWDNIHDFMGPLLKKELINIKILNDILHQNNVDY